MPILKYDDDEWAQILVKDPAWSRQETDYLLDLCEQFDLRFLIIADRYAVSRQPLSHNTKQLPLPVTRSKSITPAQPLIQHSPHPTLPLVPKQCIHA